MSRQSREIRRIPGPGSPRVSRVNARAPKLLGEVLHRLSGFRRTARERLHLRPRDQSQLMRLHQMRMRGNDANTEAIGATFRGGHSSLVKIIAVAIARIALIENSDRGISDSAILGLAVIRFHAHMFRIDRTEMHFRATCTESPTAMFCRSGFPICTSEMRTCGQSLRICGFPMADLARLRLHAGHEFRDEPARQREGRDARYILLTIRCVLKTGVTLRIDSRINWSQASGNRPSGFA